MHNKPNRVARLTSSKISPLTISGKGVFGFGAGAITYIKDKIAELDLGRGIETPIYKQEMAWGKCWEHYVNDILGIEYELVSDKTTVHPDFEYWSGSEDYKLHIDGNGVAEQKSYYLRNFYEYSKCLMKQDISLLRENFKKEYWQIVSNSCIHQTKYGEAISFTPTEAQLLDMRELLEDTNYIEEKVKDDLWKYRFIYEKDLYDLPFIPKHSDFPNMTKFRFEVPQSDKDFLTDRVQKAIELINNEELIINFNK